MSELAEAFALSPQQEAVLRLSRQAGPLAGAVSAVIAVEGELEPERLEAALARLCAGAEILRSVFPAASAGAGGMQSPLPATTPALKRHDLSGLPPEEQERTLETLREALLRDLPQASGAVPLRFALARLDGRRNRLLVAASGLVADGRSLELLPEALARAYGGEAPWPEALLQYADLAQWQNELLESDDSREARAFWRRHDLAEAERQRLPFDAGPARGEAAFAPRSLPMDLPAGTLDALARTTAAIDLEAQDLLLASWHLLIARLSGQDATLVGLVSDGRSYEELASAPGPLARTLPLRLSHALDRPFAELAQRLAAARRQALEWQDGFARSLLPESGPLLPQAFEYQAAAAPSEVAGLRWQLQARWGQPEPTEVTLVAQETAEGLKLRLDYDGRRRDLAQMQRLVGWFATLLEAALAAPGSAAGSLPLAGPAELDRLLREFNATERACPQEPFHRLFEAAAARHGVAPAVQSAEGCLSYAELEARANRIARRLIELGVRRGDRVGLHLPPGLDLPAALLGVLKAGAAFVPLDAIHPPARLAQMAEDAALAALVVGDARQSRLLLPGLATLDLAGECALLDALEPEPPPVAGEGRDLAYVLFTSGSTGRPKGVMVPHRGLVNYASWAAEAYDLEGGQGAPVHTSIGFDLTVTALLVPLLAGRCLHLLPLDQGIQPLAEALAPGSDWSLVKLTPSHLQALAPLLPEGPLAGRTRHFVVGGEALHGETLAAWRERAPETLVVNEYGPTETVVGCCVHALRAGGLADGLVPIGRPIANTRLYVLDEDLRPLPWGMVGELWIGGEGVAWGYAGRPGLTAKRFLPDPFATRPGARMYRSGDLVRLRDDGLLDYLGRRDEQVKLRGFRIEAAEIEAVLARHPRVRQAAVAVVEQRLVAWLVPEGEGRPDPDEVLRHCAQWLPDYMVPAQCLSIAALPLGPSGKLDRRALPAPERETGRYVAPRNAEEALLAGIWAEVLKLERVGVEDDFFRLGGDSILSLQIVARAARAGLRLTPQIAFRLRTVAEQVAALPPAASAARDEGSPVEGPLLPTPLQARFLAGDQTDADHDNQAVLLRPRAPLAVEPLEAVAAALELRHPLLRLRVAGEGLRIAPPAEGPRIRDLDLGDLPEAERAAAITAACEAVQASLDRRQGPLWRPALLRLGGEQRLLIVAHHLCIDGVSWRMLLDDLTAGLAAGLAAEPDALDAAPFGPSDPMPRRWAEALGRAAQGGALDRDAAWWLERNWSNPARLPLGSASRVARSRKLQQRIDPAVGARLLSAPHGRPLELMLAALALAWRNAAGAGTLVVDLEGHGREPSALGEPAGSQLDLSRSLGWFTSLFPLPLRPGPDPLSSWQQVRGLLGELPHQGLAPAALRQLAPDRPAARELAALPDAQVLFNYLGRFDAGEEGSPFAFAGESAGTSRGGGRPRSHALEITASSVAGHGFLDWHHDDLPEVTALVAGLAEDFERQLDRLLGLLESAPAMPLALPGLDETALRALEARYGSGTIERLLPLSPLQQGMLFHSLAAPGSGVYLDQSSWQLSGILDPVAFRAVWDRLVARHAVLRTAFFESGGHSLQVELRQAEAPWRIEDWSALPSEEQESRFAALRDRERSADFDLSQAPLMRFALVRLGAERWRFLWTRHHVLLDGWSLGPLLRELSGEVPLPAADAADWLAWLARQDNRLSEAFWRARLADLRAPTPVGGRSGPAGPTTTRRLQLPAGEEAALRRLAGEAGLTLASLIAAAWGLLLARRSGEESVTFGVTFSGRPPDLPGIENSVGLFINTLPLRLAIGEDRPSTTWLAEVRDEIAALAGQQHCSLVDIQGWSGVPRGLPLFESLFVYENFPRAVAPAAAEPGVLRVEAAESFEQTSYPLTLVAGEDEGLLLELRYDSRRFPAAEAEALLQGLQALLRSFPTAGAAPLSTLVAGAPRAPAEAPAQVFGDLACLHRLFERQAALHPEAVAVSHGDRTLSYAELEASANRLAHHLRAAGVRVETPVGLCVPPSADLIVAILAILKAGGAYVPLDPGHPAERLAYVLDDAQAPLVVVTGATAGKLGGEARVIDLDAEAAAIAARPSSPPAVELPAEALAYVIYTSGSTGQPKGCLVSHANVARLLRAAEAPFGFDGSDVWTLFHSAAFDFSVWEIWGALAFGGRLVVVDPLTARSPEAFRRLLSEERVTVLNQTPSAFRALQEADRRASDPLALRWVIFGGEALHPHLLQDWFARHGEARPKLVNMYGITETTVHVTLRAMTAADAEDAAASPIGPPLDDLVLHLLDSRMQPVPDGQVGEIFVGGAGVARGYLGRPALTAERFLPDPFSRTPGARLYRSGDLARRRLDGELDYLGRADQQLKVRGYRIEPGEVEARLAACPGVREAVVVGAGGQAGGGYESLLAYLVASDPLAPPEREALRHSLRAALPEPLIPAAFTFLDALPLTVNGKLDRARLPVPATDDVHGGPVLLPRDGVELRLARIWEELLERRGVGVHDDFFDLGGHSLLAIRLAGRIAQDFGRGVTLAELLARPTVAALAEALRQNSAERGTASPLVTLQGGGSRPPFFAVHPAGGSPLCYLALALRLGPRQPFHAFQAPGLEDAAAPLESVEAMAAHYLEALRRVQPKGPYRLGGYSLGGVVAFEMAQRLAAAGEEIALLAMLDAPATAPSGKAEVDEAALLLRLLPDLVPGLEIPALPAEGSEEERLGAVIGAVRAAGALPEGYGLTEVRRLTSVFRSAVAAMRSYEPRPAALRVTLFRARDNCDAPGTAGPAIDLGWGRVALGGVEVVTVEGSHESMMAEPQVADLAEALRAHLGDGRP